MPNLEKDQLPQDIDAARGLNLIMGVCLLLVAVFPGFPVAMGIYHDGLSSVVGWPPLFNWFALLLVSSVASGLYTIFAAKPVGVTVRFEKDGFVLSQRLWLRPRTEQRIVWSDVKHVQVLDSGRHEGITISGADGPLGSFVNRYAAISLSETVNRLRQSAENAGYALERDGGFNLFLMRKDIWRVVPISSS
ncbi:MAG: hypothetical protein AAFQ09_11825 [Pseudomonadota bacterium]